MEDLGLNKYLQPLNTPIANSKGAQSSYSFDTDNERNTITLSKIKSFSFNSGTGGTIQLGGTANGSGVATVVNEGGTTLVSIDSNGINYYGSATFSEYFIDGTSVASIGLDLINFGGIGIQSTGYSGWNVPIYFQSNSIISSNASDYIYSRGGTLPNPGEILLTQNRLDITAGTTTINGGTTNIIGTFKVNGVTKTAIVPTSKGYKAMYCTESPNVWFTDIGTIHRPKWYEFWKEPTYTFDPLFLETVEKVEHIIPTMNPNIVEVKGKRKGFENVRMEDKTVQEFYNNNEFWGQADK